MVTALLQISWFYSEARRRKKEEGGNENWGTVLGKFIHGTQGKKEDRKERRENCEGLKGQDFTVTAEAQWNF